MSAPASAGVAFLFDLDGTLIDSVYQHVLAWREATQAAGIELPVWRIHRQIGMSGGLMLNALLRETGRPVSKKEAEHIQAVHAKAFAEQAPSSRILLVHKSCSIRWPQKASLMPSQRVDVCTMPVMR